MKKKITRLNEIEEKYKNLVKEEKSNKKTKQTQNETDSQQNACCVRLMEDFVKIKCDESTKDNIYNCHFIDNCESKFSLKFEEDKFIFTPSDYLSKRMPEVLQDVKVGFVSEAPVFLVILFQGYYKVGLFQESDKSSS